jgi:hypothetical protein
MNEEQAKLNIRVQPGASKNMVSGYTDGVFNIKITTRPEKGKANESLIKYLSDLLGIAKSRISISKGNTSRNKVVLIQDLSNQNAVSRLMESINRKDSQ